MVLKMSDLGKCRESFQTPWNLANVLANGFATTFVIAGEDLGWIPKGPKSADFEQKALAHGFAVRFQHAGRFPGRGAAIRDGGFG